MASAEYAANSHEHRDPDGEHDPARGAGPAGSGRRCRRRRSRRRRRSGVCRRLPGPARRRRSSPGTAPRGSAAGSRGSSRRRVPSRRSSSLEAGGLDLAAQHVVLHAQVVTPGRSGQAGRLAGELGRDRDARARWRRSARAPLSTTRPPRMIVTRSHTASTSARMWLESSTVRPSSRSSAMHSRNAASISGSRPDVGSSSSSSSTSEASAATSATFWRLPLEYERPFLVGSRSKRSSRSARRCASSPPRMRPSRSMTSPPVRLGHSATSPGT